MSETDAVAADEAHVIADSWSQRDKTDGVKSHRRNGAVLRRFGPFAALPLSLLAVATALVVMLGMHKSNPEEPAAAPPPSDVQPTPAAPEEHAPPLDIMDRAFIAVLTQGGVPVPNPEYVTTHGHAVCDFLAHQPNLAEAVRFVQRSSIWDADQAPTSRPVPSCRTALSTKRQAWTSCSRASRVLCPICKPSKVLCNVSKVICKASEVIYRPSRATSSPGHATTTASVLVVANLRDQEVQEVVDSELTDWATTRLSVSAPDDVVRFQYRAPVLLQLRACFSAEDRRACTQVAQPVFR